MRQTRALWLKIVQTTYPNVLKPIARQIQIEKVVARKRGADPVVAAGRRLGKTGMADAAPAPRP